MPVMERLKTKHVGVYYIMGAAISTGKPERIYYIMYRRDGRLIEEKAGRQFQDDMTERRAARIRAERIDGKSLSNKERRKEKKQQKEIQEWTIKRLWDAYLETKPQTRSFRIDDQRFKLHIDPVLGNRELKDLVPLDLDRLRISLLKQKSPQTVKSAMALIKRISNFAKNKRLCPSIDFKIILPKVNNAKTEFLTEEQLKKLMAVIAEDLNPYAGSIMLTALYTGMRKSEILKLEWNDIDFERGFIHIRGPKGGQDARIPLNDPARAVFEKLPRTHELVFPGLHGQRMGLYHAIARIKEKAELPADFRPLHGLRHQYASMLASSGKVDMYVLQKLLNHRSPIMTQRYAHLRDESLKKASDLAGELVNEAVKQAEQEEKADNVILLR
jgi:integrase